VQTIAATTSVVELAPSQARTRPRRSRFYVGISVAMTAIVVVGFWASYFGPMLRGNVARPWVIQLHGAVYAGWMALLLAQVALVAGGRTRTHRRLGQFGIWYGCLVLVMGVAVSFAAPLLHLAAGEWDMDRAAAFLIIPLGDMVLFAGFFGAAVAYRSKPDVHKRLIVLATVALLFAAIGRMSFIQSTPLLLLIWVSPVLVALAHEALTRRRLDPIYSMGLVILLAGAGRVAVAQSDPWMRTGRALLRSLM
jgi:hypothetical protein